MNPSRENSGFERDLQAIGAIASIPKMLDLICRTTGMCCATVAIGINERWIATAA